MRCICRSRFRESSDIHYRSTWE